MNFCMFPMSRDVALQVPVSLDQSSYSLVVKGEGGGITIYNSTSIDVDTKTLSSFIQTDKGAYKPGQKGQYLHWAAMQKPAPF